MNQALSDREFPSLFSHQKRADWGIGVLSGEQDGKRRYLFEDGEERTLGAGGIALMLKVDQPSRDQQAACARLMTLLAKRDGRPDTSESPSAAAVLKQLERLRKKYHGGFGGKDWRADQQNAFARQTRAVIAPKLQAELSKDKLARLEQAGARDQLWGMVVSLLSQSGLVPAPLRTTRKADELRLLSDTTRLLLHGAESYEKRFDHFLAAYQATFKEHLSWQAATALPALMTPVDEVYVDPNSFRKQLKALARPGTLGPRPTGAAYLRCLAMAQALANMLAARGEVPRDLLDVHDFVRVTI